VPKWANKFQSTLYNKFRYLRGTFVQNFKTIGQTVSARQKKKNKKTLNGSGAGTC